MITAGVGSTQWRLAGRRLGRQAHRSHWFSSVESYHTESLRALIPEFFRHNSKFIGDNSRGYGYWLWRPYLLLNRVKALKADEVVVFLDAGCESNINSFSGKRLLDYVDIAKDSGLCVMRTPYLLTSWCKKDTLEVFGVPDNSNIRTVEPGVFFLTRSKQNISLLEDWIDLARKKNYHHLDDSPSISPNLASFIEHRHDQSLLTAMLMDRPETAIEQETYFPNNSWRTAGAEYPLWVVRNPHPFLHESGEVTSVAYGKLRKVLKGH